MFKVKIIISEDIKFEDINLESLKNEKAFQKIGRKQQKELDALRKRQTKEKMTIQKQQCGAIEKAVKGKKWVYQCILSYEWVSECVFIPNHNITDRLAFS